VRMRNRRPDPVLMGEPSPALSKMARMNRADLALQIERLITEATRIKAKVEKLKAHKPCPEERVVALNEQLKRLAALEQTARNKLAVKELHKTQREDGIRR
jgi:hypothetical protein